MSVTTHLKHAPHRPTLGVLYILLIALFVLAACGGGADGGASIASDPETAVRDALKQQLTAAPFRVTNQLSMDGATTQQVIVFVSPQEMSMQMEDMEIRLVDGKAFQLVDGVWEENPSASAIGAGVAGMYNAEALETMIGVLSNVRASGTEDVNGDRARVYEYASEQDFGTMKATSTHKLWVREADGLPVKQVAQTDTDGVKSSSETLVEYDANLKVEAP